MISIRTKGYVLTYAGFLLAITVAATLSFIITNAVAPKFIDTMLMPDSTSVDALGNMFIAILVGGALFIGIFIVSSLILLPIILRLILNKIPQYRTATIIWAMVLLLSFPVVFTLLISLSVDLLLSLAWIIPSPLVARYLSTRNRQV